MRYVRVSEDFDTEEFKDARAPDEPVEPDKKGGIPGFPLESLVLGIMVSAVVLWLLRRSL